jgi:spoIIIJ-associated protein
MEWVETTGRSIEDAKEAALDELGVDESDAEFEVLEEARAGLFGRLRGEARVRARVRPTAPRAKEDRRDRRRRNRPSSDTTAPSGHSNGESTSPAADGDDETAAPTRSAAGAADAAALPVAQSGTGSAAAKPDSGTGSSSPRGGSRRRGGRPPAGDKRPAKGAGSAEGDQDSEPREGANVEVALDEQGRIAQEFLTELVGEFGLQAAVRTVRPDDDTVDIQLEGSDFGLLIGPKGSTLLALQDLTRTVVHHQTGAGNGRIHVDVGGYRQRRTEALVRFAQQVAGNVQQSGTRSVLEPMTAADRKVVHDAITNIDGVSTISEGEEPRRRVVIVPDEH